MSNQSDLELENFLELIEQVLDTQPAAVVNPPAPSGNNFSQSVKNLTFTEQEINQLERVMSDLEPKKNHQEIKKKLKQELKEELKFELLEEKKTAEEEKQTFKKELVNYSLEYASVEITIQSGKSILGILCKVKNDFIVLINQNNQFIKIPIEKIIAVKEVTNLDNNKQKKMNSKIEKEAEMEKKDTTMKDEAPLPAPEKLLAREFVKIENRTK